MLLAHALHSQSEYQLGTLPSINVNKSLGSRWFINGQWQSRQAVVQGVINQGSESGFSYILNDFTFIAGRKVGLNNSVAGGMLFRFRDDQVIYRSIQQLNLVSRLSGLRLGHRVVTDQTFVDDESLTFRLRYRVASEIPLNGQSVDTKELYLKLSNEYLNAWQETSYEMEIRIIPIMGYVINTKNKIELGLDYRIGSVTGERPEQVYWLNIGWYLKL